MKTNLTIQRNWLFGGYTSTYSLNEDISSFAPHLTELAWKLLHVVIPNEARRGKIIRNIKGRDSNNLVNSQIPSSSSPISDELYFVSGLFLEDLEGEPKEEDEPSRFVYSINTAFSDFVGHRAIDHKCIINKHGPIPEFLERTVYDPATTATIDVLRIGVDFFNNHILGFLGFAPEVTQTILFEINLNNLSLRLSADRLKTKNAVPFQNESIFENLQKVFLEIFKFDLLKDYLHLQR